MQPLGKSMEILNFNQVKGIPQDNFGQVLILLNVLVYRKSKRICLRVSEKVAFKSRDGLPPRETISSSIQPKSVGGKG
ncbi:hypothetical protein TNCV_2179361 [Trichonephila clavipes]|uniref:Uncharacterized protein n=1 Tax=Trichonephila clavipes TaxID=2585209 RepID=A0A8X6VUI5_TRICX|nr:hypothetical protein TNCV_2179361 [Trichonephila clavipes]